MSAQPALQKTPTHSTGPRSKAGKAISSQNALRHGLASGTLFIEGEDQAEWQSLFTSLLEEWQPATPTEHLHVQAMARHHWLVERAIRLQGEALAAIAEPGTLPASFAVLLRYQIANERAFARAQKTLQEMQRARREFVSQQEAHHANAQFQQQMARLTAPPPAPDYEKIIERMNAARRPSPPAPTQESNPQAARQNSLHSNLVTSEL